MLGELIRKNMFWLFDALSGGLVRKYLLNLEKTMQQGNDASSDDLQKLLNHAVSTTEFYKEYSGYSGITDFPVIKKNMIKEKYDQFISAKYKNKQLHQMKTSGSTGERFVMLQDKQKRKKVIAELIYFYEQCGFMPGYRYVYARVWFKDNKKSKLACIAQNRIMFDSSFLSEDSLQRLYQVLRKDQSIKCLTGYANTLAAIAIYFDKKGYTPDLFNFEVIVSGAERLEPSAKVLLKKVFGCAVVSRYSNQENGVFAQQGLNSEEYILNNPHYFFETLCLDNDESAPYGEPARFVITDIYNYAMPVIRYDTGDIVIAGVSEINGLPKMVLTDVSGRQDEIIYDTAGNMISPHFVALQFRSYDRLTQFQLIQDSFDQFTLKLEGARGLYSDNDFINTVRQLVGINCVVKIEHLDKISHLSSGKFKKVICNYKVN